MRIGEWLLFNTKSPNFLAISWREQVNFQRLFLSLVRYLWWWTISPRGYIIRSIVSASTLTYFFFWPFIFLLLKTFKWFCIPVSWPGEGYSRYASRTLKKSTFRLGTITWSIPLLMDYCCVWLHKCCCKLVFWKLCARFGNSHYTYTYEILIFIMHTRS